MIINKLFWSVFITNIKKKKKIIHTTHSSCPNWPLDNVDRSEESHNVWWHAGSQSFFHTPDRKRVKCHEKVHTVEIRTIFYHKLTLWPHFKHIHIPSLSFSSSESCGRGASIFSLFSSCLQSWQLVQSEIPESFFRNVWSVPFLICLQDGTMKIKRLHLYQIFKFKCLYYLQGGQFVSVSRHITHPN